MLSCARGSRTVANERVHGTTHEQPVDRWNSEQQQLKPIGNRLPYPCADDQLRRVGRDAYVAWNGSRDSVPWQYADKDVWVREKAGRLEIHCGSEKVATHERAERHRVITHADHHRGIPLGAAQRRRSRSAIPLRTRVSRREVGRDNH